MVDIKYFAKGYDDMDKINPIEFHSNDVRIKSFSEAGEVKETCMGSSESGIGIGTGSITYVQPLECQKLQAEIYELNARAELFKAGVKLLAKYEEFLDFTTAMAKEALKK